MPHELVFIIMISILFLIIFALSEMGRFYFNISAEVTRKFVHISSGIASLSFCYLFKSHWSVLILCILFVLLLVITKKKGLLQSIHAVNRESKGTIYHPVAIYLLFLFASILNQPLFYLISILVLAISDTLAALIGKKYGFNLYLVQSDNKSLEGSIIFFLSTFIIVHLMLLLSTDVGKTECILISLFIAILVTAFEAISIAGADNLFIPLGTFYILSKNYTKSTEEIVFQMLILSLIFLITYIIVAPAKKIGISGIIGLALFGYAAWALVSFTWFVPVLVGIILISYTDIFLEKPANNKEFHRICPVFYILIVPLIWILIANLTMKLFALYPVYLYLIPFMVGILSQLSILWGWKSRYNLYENKKHLPGFIKNSNTFIRALILLLVFEIAGLPEFVHLNILFSTLSCLVGIIISDRLYWYIAKKNFNHWLQINYLRMGMFVVMGVSLLIFLTNCIFYHYY